MAKTLTLRPGITHPKLWYPERPAGSEWGRIRKQVLERDNWSCQFCGHRALTYMNVHHLEESGSADPRNLTTICVACHAVSHFGRNLSLRMIEIWESTIPQVVIVQKTRDGISRGLSLEQIRRRLPIKRGPLPPDSIDYANNLIKRMGSARRAY